MLRINATAKIGIIRVLTTDDIHLLNMHGTLIEALFPNLDVVSRCIPNHPKGVYNSETEASAGPLVVRLAREFEAENCSAVIISCASDPGLDMARKNVGIPVIGAGEAAALLGRAFGRKVGVLGIGSSTPKRMERILGDLLVGYSKPEGVENTTNLLTAESQRAVLDAGLKLKQAGAEVIVLACTGLSTAGSAALLSMVTGLRVVDAVQAAGFLAYYAVTF